MFYVHSKKDKVYKDFSIFELERNVLYIGRKRCFNLPIKRFFFGANFVFHYYFPDRWIK